MRFTKIDMENWSRKPYFDHYMSTARCTYSMTADIDITGLLGMVRSKNVKLYTALIYMASTVINRHEEFRMSFDQHGNLGCWDVMHPCFTIFHADDQTFSSIWTTYCDDFSLFYCSYLEDIRRFGDRKGFSPKGNEPPNTFPISSIPWISFTGFNLNVYDQGTYLTPIITCGKYFERNGRTLLPFSLQVHHAVCDGYHASRFFIELQDLADNCSAWLR